MHTAWKDLHTTYTPSTQEGGTVISILKSNRFGQPIQAICDEHDPPAFLELSEDGNFHDLEYRFRAFVKAHRNRTFHT